MGTFSDLRYIDRLRFLLYVLSLRNPSHKGMWPVAGPILPNKSWGIALLVCSDGDWLRNATQWMMRDLFGVDVFGQPNDPPSVFEPEIYKLEEQTYLAAVAEILEEMAQSKAERTELVTGFQLPWTGGWSYALLACHPMQARNGDASRTLDAIETLSVGIDDYAPPEVVADLTDFVSLVRSYGK